MKGKKFFVIFSLLTLCTGAFSACDQDPDPPRYPDIIEPDYTTSKEINVFKFNGYYLKGLNDNISISYATVRDTLMRGNEIKISVDRNLFHPVFNSLTNILSWDHIVYNPYDGDISNSSFSLTDQGTLSNLSYTRSISYVGTSAISYAKNNYSWHFSYDESGRLIGIEHTNIYASEDGRRYEEEIEFQNDTLQSKYTLKWENENITEISILSHSIKTKDGVLEEDATKNSVYKISYSDMLNPARQYPVRFSYLLVSDDTLRLLPLIGFLGNGPAYLPSSIRYSVDGEEDFNCSIEFVKFVIGDVHGTEAILEESNDRGYYKYHYEP